MGKCQFKRRSGVEESTKEEGERDHVKERAKGFLLYKIKRKKLLTPSVRDRTAAVGGDHERGVDGCFWAIT